MKSCILRGVDRGPLSAVLTSWVSHMTALAEAERKQVKGPAWNPSLCQVRAGCLLTTDTGLLWSFLYHSWEGRPERQDLFPVTQCQLIEFGFSPLPGGTPVISPHAPVSPHVKEFPACNCPAEVLEQQQQQKNTHPIAWDWQFSGSGKRWYKKIEDIYVFMGSLVNSHP